MNVEVCKEYSMNVKARLRILKHGKSEEEFQDESLNFEASEECRKNFKTRL